jgi:hypothetical protein
MDAVGHLDHVRPDRMNGDTLSAFSSSVTIRGLGRASSH